MVEREQVRPLAPASERLSSDDDENVLNQKALRRKKCIRCCGCIAALLLIQAVVVIILIFTVFKVKDPKIKLNGVTIDKLELVSGTNIPRPGTNMSLTADVSVKNPNFASFKYKNTTTALYYYGSQIGEARGPPGHAKAHRTMRMNITVDIMTDNLISNPNLQSDANSGKLILTSYSRVAGRVNMLKLIKKHVIVKMNCSMTVNITSREILEQKCKRKVKL
ncbi:unnamed protein product [Ilex paraguariensis]|uniref:Late embryogenesis abundant protein LEA-2 subgroup domain-containing protein n=1 Tax=Ilex paraguariensis TaxID=185542 RepID=A0ABC8QQ40_9AQUA